VETQAPPTGHPHVPPLFLRRLIFPFGPAPPVVIIEARRLKQAGLTADGLLRELRRLEYPTSYLPRYEAAIDSFVFTRQRPGAPSR
jgi:hypothetical protein